MTKVGDIIVTDTGFPLIVVSVNDNDGTYEGTEFGHGGNDTYRIIAPEGSEAAKTQELSGIREDFDNASSVDDAISRMSDAEKADLIAKLGGTVQSDPSPSSSDPSPSPSSSDPSSSSSSSSSDSSLSSSSDSSPSPSPSSSTTPTFSSSSSTK